MFVQGLNKHAVVHSHAVNFTPLRARALLRPHRVQRYYYSADGILVDNVIIIMMH